MDQPRLPLPSLFPLPPTLVDLNWTPAEHDVGLHVAKATKQFWLLWTPADEPVLRSCGITITNGGFHYLVHFAAMAAPADFQERLDALQALRGEAIAEQAREDRAHEAYLSECTVKRVEAERQWGLKVDETRRTIDLKLAQLGSFMAEADRMILERLAVKETIYLADVEELTKTLRRVEIKSNRFAREAGKVVREREPLTLDEAEIIRACRHMTGLDADHSSEPNQRGWDSKDSPWGHWCCASFGTEHHDIAVGVARKILATYQDTQLRRMVP